MKLKWRIFPVATSLLLCLSATAFADPVSDAEDVPATAAEMQFINRVIDQVKAAVPPLDGWNRDVSVTASGNTVREGKPVLIFENARNFPLKINMQLNFSTITSAQREMAATEKSGQQLQQEMMDAINKGDMERVAKIQQQIRVMTQAQMTSGPMGQAAAGVPVTPVKKSTRFYVQVIVNGEGEHIGKQYDMTVPGVTHAFRVDKGKEDYISYKYYIGAWEVSELDKRNWKVLFPKHMQSAATHLRALVLSANVYGDRESVEKYVKGSLDLKGLKNVLD